MSYVTCSNNIHWWNNELEKIAINGVKLTYDQHLDNM